MGRIGIVTDSTADVPAEMARELGISVIPCQVIFGDTTYQDGVDLSPEEFYARLSRSQELPHTSQPPVQAFIETYRRLIDEEGCEAVFSIHVAGTLSGTTNAAWAAVQALPDPARIEIVDSGQVSMGLGWIVVEAPRAAQGTLRAAPGTARAQVAAAIRSALPRVRTVAMIDTLENLYKGGRIRLFSAALGTALQIKPLVSLADGEITVWAKVRTRSRALNALVARIQEMGSFQDLAVLHADAQDLVQILASRLQERLPGQEMPVIPAGSALVSHLGLGAVGACALIKE
jgi:DegV family protein with EDD domain